MEINLWAIECAISWIQLIVCLLFLKCLFKSILCDIPLLGELFKHRELATVNSELLIFLTPYVIGPDYDRDAIESEPLERLREQMMPEAELGDLQAPTTESDDQTRVSAAADTDTSARE